MNITGKVTRIQSKNDSDWTVFYVELYDDMFHNTVKVTGVTDDIQVDDEVEIGGEYVEHEKWGVSFKSTYVRKVLPASVSDYANYLVRNIKGIGIITARNIVNRFQENTFHVIETAPEELVKITGISTKKAFSIQSQYLINYISNEEQMLFIKLGISDKLSYKIKQTYGDQCKEILMTNPYQLVEDIDRVGFKTADEIAMKAGIKKTSPCRIKSGIKYTLEAMGDAKGHSYLPMQELISYANKILSVPRDLIEAEIAESEREKKIVVENGNAYVKKFYDMEISIAKKLSYIFKNGIERKYSDTLEADIMVVEKQKNVSLDETQRAAVMNAIKKGISIITGGPGVGKTTTLNVLIGYLTSHKIVVDDIVLLAPTGRAAKRMQEQTNLEAKTIHRMIAELAQKREFHIDANTIIVDEMSMVDLPLMSNLLNMIEAGTRIVLVGDVDQLPSVGVGKVLRDLIESNVLPVTRLVNIYRQAAESNIIQNAHRINKGKPLPLDVMHDDFFYCRRQTVDKVMDAMKILIKERMPKRFNIAPTDIQILVPMRKGGLGMYNINTVMQEFLNPADSSKQEYQPSNSTLFREGDKVIQTKNNYNLEWIMYEKDKHGNVEQKSGLGVFNGEVGFIKCIDKSERTISITFENGQKTAYYSYDDMNEVELAYAMTIHKSQGSEFPAIIIPVLDKGHEMLYNRNLIYTGVTRAKDCVGIIGNKSVIEYMASNTKSARRYSTLSNKLQEVFKECLEMQNNAS